MPTDKHIPGQGQFPFQELFTCDLLTTSHFFCSNTEENLGFAVGSGSASLIFFFLFSAVRCNPIDQYFATMVMGQLIAKS